MESAPAPITGGSAAKLEIWGATEHPGRDIFSVQWISIKDRLASLLRTFFEGGT
jgi:hypothetical protein